MTKDERGPVAVVALGGNAITREFEEGNIKQQFANTRRALTGVVDLVEHGYRLAITHGNGPQVGNALIRVEATRNIVPPIPLGVLVADLEGGMGYMIAQTMQNKLAARHIGRSVVVVLAQTLVAKDDPSISNPTKFVGPFYKQEDVERLRTERGYVIKEDPGRGFRRVVASPKPLEVIEAASIRQLVEQGTIVITVGGGGIPVYWKESGQLEGVDAVIDKDRASAVLAREIKAEELFIFTSVDKVALNYKKANQVNLDTLTTKDAKRYLDQGQFPAGSMGPKIEAAVDFLQHGGKRVLICSIDNIHDALAGNAGTEILPD